MEWAIHWQKQIRQYADLISPNFKLSDQIKRFMLENRGINDLCIDKTQS